MKPREYPLRDAAQIHPRQLERQGKMCHPGVTAAIPPPLPAAAPAAIPPPPPAALSAAACCYNRIYYEGTMREL